MRPNACKSVKQDFLWLAWLSRRQWCQASIYFPQKFLKEILFPKWIGFPIFNACFKLSLLVTLIKLMRAILLFVCYFFLSIAGQKYHKHVMYISSLLIFFWLSEVVLWCSSWLNFSHVSNPFLPSFWVSDWDMSGPDFQRSKNLSPQQKKAGPFEKPLSEKQFQCFCHRRQSGLSAHNVRNLPQFTRLRRTVQEAPKLTEMHFISS